MDARKQASGGPESERETPWVQEDEEEIGKL